MNIYITTSRQKAPVTDMEIARSTPKEGSRFQIQIDLLNEKDIEMADLNVGVLREALECALKTKRKE